MFVDLQRYHLLPQSSKGAVYYTEEGRLAKSNSPGHIAVSVGPLHVRCRMLDSYEYVARREGKWVGF